MEDAATAEISRAQLWQWIRHGARLDDGRVVTRELVTRIIEDELASRMEAIGPSRYVHGSFGGAQALLELSLDPERFDDFLTLAAYQRLVHEHAEQVRREGSGHGKGS